MNTKSCLAELFGTFLFVFVGAGSIIIDAHTNGGVGLLGIAVAHGLALSVVVSSTMNISGGQINPAITIGLLLIKKIKALEAVGHIIAQLIGAAMAGLLLKLLFPPEAITAVKLGTPALGEGISAGTAVGLEIIGTFFLAFAIYGTAVNSKAPSGIAGFGIGLVVTSIILAIGPLTGSALNPARHFGTAIFAPHLSEIWIYWVGPIIGAALGFILFNFIAEEKTKKGK